MRRSVPWLPVVFGLLMAVTLGLMACVPAASPTAAPPPAGAAPTPTTAPVVQPKFGGTMNWGSDATLKSIDPVWTTACVTHNVARGIWEPLFTWDVKFNTQPMLAESWKASADLKSWTFTIRDGIKFHDGTTVTAADVVESMKRWGIRYSPGPTYYGLVETVEATDARTIKANFKKSFGLAADYLAQTPYIMPKSIAATPADKSIDKYIGTSPFKFVEWKEGDRLVLEKFNDYKSRSEPTSGKAGARIAYLDRVVIKEVPDASTRVAAVEVGELDVAHLIPTDYWDRLVKNPAVTVYKHEPSSTQATVFNTVNFPSSDQRFREAVGLIQDKKEYMKLAIGPDALYEVCPAVFFCGNKWESNASQEKYYDLNLARAKQLIDEIKKDTGWDGKAIVMTNTDYKWLYQFGVLTDRDLREKLGLKVDFQIMDWATLVTKRAQKTGWNIFHTGFSFTWNDPVVAGWTKPTWFAYYDSPQMAKLLEDFMTAPDDAARKKIIDNIQTLVYTDWPIVHLGQNYFISVYNNARVRDYLQLDGCDAVWWNTWLAK